MSVYFADSSALGKRYIAETGSTWLRATLDPTIGAITFIARITSVEVIAAISRRERSGSLTSANANLARRAFRNDLSAEYQIVEITESVANRAMLLAERHRTG